MAALTQAQCPYEDARRLRLEENKRRLQELGISDISRTISEAFKKAKTTTISATPQKPRDKIHGSPELYERRRSLRIANISSAGYKDKEPESPKLLQWRSDGDNTHRRYLSTSVLEEARNEAAVMTELMIIAKNNKNPSFVKRMSASYVSSGFRLGLPLAFCKAHLPKNDKYMKLMNEKGGVWESLYLARNSGLSAGWKRFAEDNQLSDGDAVLFELVGHDEFKCYITRAEEDAEGGGRRKKRK